MDQFKNPNKRQKYTGGKGIEEKYGGEKILKIECKEERKEKHKENMSERLLIKVDPSQLILSELVLPIV